MAVPPIQHIICNILDYHLELTPTKFSDPNFRLHDTVCPACLWVNDEIRFKELVATGWGSTGQCMFFSCFQKKISPTFSLISFSWGAHTFSVESFAKTHSKFQMWNVLLQWVGSRIENRTSRKPSVCCRWKDGHMRSKLRKSSVNYVCVSIFITIGWFWWSTSSQIATS